MQRKRALIAGLLGIFTLATVFTAGARPATAQEEDRWPMEVPAELGMILIYEPQIETFEGDHLTARAAVSFTPTGTESPVFGAAWFKARLSTDRETRIAVLADVEVTNARFPEATPEQVERFGTLVRAEFLKTDLTMSLDELIAGLALAEKGKLAGADLKNAPPKI